MDVQMLEDTKNKRAERFDRLAFVAASWSAINYWEVQATGNYKEDMRLGRRYAEAALAFIAAENAPYIMGHIIQAMPKEHTGIERGFILALTERALA